MTSVYGIGHVCWSEWNWFLSFHPRRALSKQVPKSPFRSITNSNRFNPGIAFVLFSFLRWFFRLKHIPNSLRAQQWILTLKHKLVLLEAPQSSGHLGTGVVVGSGGRVTPSAQCLHTNFAFSSHLKTSHKPPATPVLMATHPAFRPEGNKAEFTTGDCETWLCSKKRVQTWASSSGVKSTCDKKM